MEGTINIAASVHFEPTMPDCDGIWMFPRIVGFPNKPMGKLLLKMISTWGGDWGYHHLRKHPNILKLLGFNSPTDRGMTRDDHPNVSDQLYANYAIGQVEGIMARFHEIYVQDISFTMYGYVM